MGLGTQGSISRWEEKQKNANNTVVDEAKRSKSLIPNVTKQ